MSHKKSVHIPVLDAGRHKTAPAHHSSVEFMGSDTAHAHPATRSRWQQFTDSLPIIGITDGERVDTGTRLNPASRLGAQIALPVLGLILNELSTTKYDKAIDFLKHYVYGRGEPYQLDVPPDWQKAIADRYRRPGIFRNVSPYNWGMKDIQNALGHFDLKVVSNPDRSLTYFISDEYKFPAPVSQRERHGFQLPGLTDERVKFAQQYLLPTAEYRTRQGFKEKWELRKVNKEWTLFIPQPFLDDYGVNFKVNGSFTVRNR